MPLIEGLLWWGLGWAESSRFWCAAGISAAPAGESGVCPSACCGLTLVGGAAGMLVGMEVFRHKTRHAAFAWEEIRRFARSSWRRWRTL